MEDKYFTEDLITDIIRRVPTKHLTRFTCVSKSWRSLIRTDPCFVPLHRTASLHRLHRQIRMDILEGRTGGDWKNRYKVWGREMAREIISAYDHLNVIPEWWRATIEHAFYKGYYHLGYATLLGCRPTLKPTSYSRCAFTLEDLQSDRLECLARLAMDRYNEARKEKWVFEEVVYLSCPFRYEGLEFSIDFGSRSIGKVLRLFRAMICNSPDKKSQAVNSVNPLEKIFNRRNDFLSFRNVAKRIKVDRMGSSGDKGKQLDNFIVRQTRKRTYVKQADSDVISYRTTEGDKIWSAIGKYGRVDEASMVTN